MRVVVILMQAQIHSLATDLGNVDLIDWLSSCRIQRTMRKMSHCPRHFHGKEVLFSRRRKFEKLLFDTSTIVFVYYPHLVRARHPFFRLVAAPRVTVAVAACVEELRA